MTTTSQTTRAETVSLQPDTGAPARLWPHVAVVAAALALWLVSLRQIDVDHLGTVGLLSALPVTWWASLALLVGGLAFATAERGTRRRPAIGYLSGALLVLYATAPLTETVPRYTYAYKHIGVTQYITTHHTVDRSIDIYHRWPGFFSFSAWFDGVAGITSPLSYAAWSEFVVSALWAVLVFVLAREVTSSVRLAEIACGVFVISNWIGQSYYSPQALAYTLTLGTYILIYRYCLGPPNRLGLRLERLVGRLATVPVRTGSPSPHALPPWVGNARAARRNRDRAAVLVLALHTVVVATHQLTPFLSLLTMALLTLAGYLRPLWLPAAAAVITLLYLLSNFGFVQDNYGVFSGLNPFTNASAALADVTQLSPGKTWVGRAALSLTLLIWLLGFAGLFRRLRQGQVRQGLCLGLFLVGPFLVLLGQSYGGEIRLRVFLFSLPWCCIAIGWLFTGRRPSRRYATYALAATSAFLVLLSVISSFGLEDVNRVRPAEVQASEWLYQNGTPGSVLMLSGPGFPSRLGADYEKFVGPNRVDVPDLSLAEGFRHQTFQPAPTSRDIDDVIEAMQVYSPHGYLVFSTTQYANNRSYGLFLNGGMARLEQGIARSPRFQLVYGNPDARIYELSDQPAAAGGPPAASPLGQQVPDQKSQTAPVEQRPRDEPTDDRGRKADH
jgi:hypothetical protein